MPRIPIATAAVQFSRARVIGLGVVMLVASCGGGAPAAPGADGTSSQLPSAVSSPAAVTPSLARPTATPSPRPEFSSTTEAADTAPPDAIDFEMAGPPPHYLPADTVARSGDVVFFVKNTSLGNHNIAIGTAPLKFNTETAINVPVALSGIVLTGHKATFTVHGLPPGDYVYWCTIDGHALEGMHGTLTVNP